MESLDVGNLGAIALVLLVLGKEALQLLAKRGNGNGTTTSVISTLRESDQRLEHMHEELAMIRASMSQLLIMYHNLEMRIAMQERETLIMRAMIER